MAEQSHTGQMLNMIAEKALHQPVKLNTMTYCPTMDLIAVATAEERVYVYRLNGQRVLGAGNKQTSPTVRSLRWKPNGQLLAVAWSDNITRLISADSGKIVHEIRAPSTDSPKIEVTLLGWAINFTNRQTVEKRLQSSDDNNDLDDILTDALTAYSSTVTLDLPRDLALLDIEDALPKLSVLLSSGKDEEVFGSRMALDAMFHARRRNEDDAVDILLIGFSNSEIHLRIYDCFDVGSFDLGRASGLARGSRPVICASHPFSSTHAILATSNAERGQLLFVPLDLRFISSSGGYLSLLASKSTQLQNLLRYIRQAQKVMEAEWRTSQDLPAKFMRNINEALQEKNGCNWVHAAYHQVVTGHCYPSVREWLVEELSERGHKRWEKAVTTGYETVQRLTHEHLLPALERCSAVVSRLRGLSTYHDSNGILGLSTQDLNIVSDVIHYLMVTAHSILIQAGQELRQFAAFSAWLRHEIDVQSAELNSASEDPADKDAGIDYANVLEFIQGAMTSTKLSRLIASPTDEDEHMLPPLPDKATSLWANRKLNMDNKDSAKSSDANNLSLRALICHLEHQCTVVFGDIAVAQRRNVLFGKPLLLAREMDAPMDARMVCKDDVYMTYTAVKLQHHSNYLYIFRISLRIENGVSSLRIVEGASLQLGAGDIKHAMFADDESMMVLWSFQDTVRLLRFAYADSIETHSDFVYHAWDEDKRNKLHTAGVGDSVKPTSFSNEDLCSSYSCHTFSESFRPASLEINGRKGRRVLCVLGEDHLHYKVFDLDSVQVGEDHEMG
ncbi:MAG: hypothetical protein M1833_002032 [Piccolia ochrophora]|nr:MAG: hypothetical protein M1833_002032 [Piccolia ochrophora]